MKKYKVIYADPPWSYNVSSQKIPSRSKEGQPYVPMRFVDIASLDVESIADDDCVMFMWATMSMIPEALYLLRAWGFEYKTAAFTWVKRAKTTDGYFWGMGSWTRANAEICLMATRGNPKRSSASVHSVVDSPVGGHSVKPCEVRGRIVKLMGDIPRIELFARQRTEGWDAWGNEVESDVTIKSK